MNTMKKTQIHRQQSSSKSGKSKIAFPASLLGLTLLALVTGLFAQDAIPSGTILPLRLNSTLNSKKSKPGEIITARLMQDVPLPSGAGLRTGSKAVGHITDVVEAQNGHGAKLSLQFDKLELSNRTIPLTTNLRAMASMMDVLDAQLPTNISDDPGTSENDWTTAQIGGDVVYRGTDQVTNGLGVVGEPTTNGVLVRIAAKPNTKCRGDLSGTDHPQALWFFSSDACGTYGFSDLRVEHAGRSNPIGQISLASDSGNIEVRSGSGLLLRVK
jgi:hypothetical protein